MTLKLQGPIGQSCRAAVLHTKSVGAQVGWSWLQLLPRQYWPGDNSVTWYNREKLTDTGP